MTDTKLPEKLKNKLIESLGEVSMCWKPRPTSQVFDSVAALKIGCRLMSDIEGFGQSMYEHGLSAPKWISVKDRLPEKEGRYLVVSIDRAPEIRFFDGASFLNYHGYRVIYWMPLPEPPTNNVKE